MHRLVCDRMFEIELISTQSDCLPSFIAGKLRVIFCISDDRASNGGKLHTDLVMTSGVQMNLKFGLVTFLTLRRQRDINRGRAAGNSLKQPAMVRNRIIMQPCNLRSVFLCRTDSGSVRPGIFDHIILECSFFLGRRIGDKRAVIFLETLIL